MRKVLKLLLVLLLFAGIPIGCSKDDIETDKKPKVDTNTLSTSMAEGDSIVFNWESNTPVCIQVQTSASSWEAKCKESWITINKSKDSFDIIVEDRNRAEANKRAARIFVTASGAEDIELLIVQSVYEYPAKPDLKDLTGEYYGVGNPVFLKQSGDPEWKGEIQFLPFDSRLLITNYGGSANGLNIDLVYGKPSIAHHFYGTIEEGSIFQVAMYDTGKEYVIATQVGKPYMGIWIPETRTMDFTGKIDGFDVMIGVIVIDANDRIVGGLTDCYTNMKFTLTKAIYPEGLEYEKVLEKACLFKSQCKLESRPLRKSDVLILRALEEKALND